MNDEPSRYLEQKRARRQGAIVKNEEPKPEVGWIGERVLIPAMGRESFMAMATRPFIPERLFLYGSLEHILIAGVRVEGRAVPVVGALTPLAIEGGLDVSALPTMAVGNCFWVDAINNAMEQADVGFTTMGRVVH